jgi:hypothetical protein
VVAVQQRFALLDIDRVNPLAPLARLVSPLSRLILRDLARLILRDLVRQECLGGLVRVGFSVGDRGSSDVGIDFGIGRRAIAIAIAVAVAVSIGIGRRAIGIGNGIGRRAIGVSRHVTQVVEAGREGPQQRLQVELGRQRCDRLRSGIGGGHPHALDAPTLLGVRGPMERALAHHFQRGQRAVFAAGATPPDDGDGNHHQTQRGEAAGRDEDGALVGRVGEVLGEDAEFTESGGRYHRDILAWLGRPRTATLWNTPARMSNAAPVDALWVVGFVVVLVGMYWAAFRIEPHWVSKDGKRFLCNAQAIGPHGEIEGRARETRVIVRDDGLLQLDQKRKMRRRITEVWLVTAKSPEPPRKRAVYLLTARGEVPGTGHLAIRLPESSRAIPVLDALADRSR